MSLSDIRNRTSSSLVSSRIFNLINKVNLINEEKKEPIKEKVLKILCNFHELPSWAQDNIYIHTGYRVPTASYRHCFQSLLFLHNETGNIYSHLLGCLAFIILAFFTYLQLSSISSAHWSDYVVVFTFIATVVICLGCSSLFHLFCCHSEQVSVSWNQCDYIGIVFLTIGSFFPAVYYGFYCNNNWKFFYLSCITCFGLLSIKFLASKASSQPQYRFHRTALFMGLGSTGIIPLLHSVLKNGFFNSIKSISLIWFVSVGSFYLIGALIYGYRIPERWFPGSFDIWFNSHQIFHLFVLIATIFHYIGVVKAFQYHHFQGIICNI